MESKTARNHFFTLEEIYISPFTHIRRFDDNGQPYYVPLERKLNPTGIYAADYLLQCFSRGDDTLKLIAARLGCSGRDLSGLIRCLTGLPSDDFRRAYRQRLVDDLLRYTTLNLSEVARLSGIGTKRNLHLFTNRLYNCTPDELRQRIRKAGDAGRFGI